MPSLDDSESIDTDGDGIGNNTELDDDNDGLLDAEQQRQIQHVNGFFNSGESVDSDTDGIGNTTDADDGDGGRYIHAFHQQFRVR